MVEEMALVQQRIGIIGASSPTCLALTVAFLISSITSLQSATAIEAASPPTGAVSPLRAYFAGRLALAGTVRGLVAWWSGEGNARDPVGGHTGKAVNGVLYWPGRFGQGFLFNGKGSAILVPDAEDLKLDHSFTLSAWISVWSASDAAHIIFRGDNRPGLDPYTISLVQGPGGTPLIQFRIEGLPAAGPDVTLTVAIPCQRFVHLVATLDDRTGQMTLWVNGQVAASAVVRLRPFRDLDPAQQPGFSIGNTQDPGRFSEPFHGLVDEVMIFNRALNPAEVRVLWNAGAAAGNKPRPWSEERILFSRTSARGSSILTVRRDGTALQRLTALGASGSYPSWSSDGNQVVFSSQEDGKWQIYRMNADGSDRTRLSHTDADDYAPAWSPDGRQIAFVSTRRGHPGLFLMNANGSDVTALTADTDGDSEPAWLPDGSRLTFVGVREGHRQIFTINPDGSYPRQLTFGPGDHTNPSWSPNGRRLVFVRSAGPDASEIWIMDRDGSHAKPLVADGLVNRHPAWSPDGMAIAFSGGGGSRHLCVIDPDGRHRRRLSDGMSSDDYPRWQPLDSRYA